MSNTVYKKIIVIGYGKITGQILEEVERRKKTYGYSVVYVEYEREPIETTQKICENLGIPCCLIEDKKELTDFFLNIKERCLIIGASNNFLFPACMTDDPHYTIVNFRNALLPKFAGRNAPSWAIYEQEKETGITWHYVTQQVDGGDIIVQKKCAIEPDIRAYELADELMRLAYEGFVEKYEAILEDSVKIQQQLGVVNRRIYQSGGFPRNGIFSMDDAAEDIYRLMRAADFGKYGIFIPVTSEYQGKKIRIVRYRKIEIEKMVDRPNVLYLPLGNGFLLQLTWVELIENNQEGGVMPDIDYFYAIENEIKKANRKYLSNCYLEQDELSKLIENGSVRYVYRKNEYINLWIRKERFDMLYYFVAGSTHYTFRDDASVIVCNVLFRNAARDIDFQLLQDAGMRKYAVYEKWACNSPAFSKIEKRDNLWIVEEDNGDLFYEKLCTYFDALSDELPEKNAWESFKAGRHFIGLYDGVNNELIGGIVYLKKESMILEDFIFVAPAYRNMGLGKLLHSTLYQMYASEQMKYIAWIRVDNVQSIKLHSAYQYKKQKQVKVTFIKTNNN